MQNETPPIPSAPPVAPQKERSFLGIRLRRKSEPQAQQPAAPLTEQAPLAGQTPLEAVPAPVVSAEPAGAPIQSPTLAPGEQPASGSFWTKQPDIAAAVQNVEAKQQEQLKNLSTEPPAAPVEAVAPSAAEAQQPTTEPLSVAEPVESVEPVVAQEVQAAAEPVAEQAPVAAQEVQVPAEPAPVIPEVGPEIPTAQPEVPTVVPEGAIAQVADAVKAGGNAGASLDTNLADQQPVIARETTKTEVDSEHIAQLSQHLSNAQDVLAKIQGQGQPVSTGSVATSNEDLPASV